MAGFLTFTVASETGSVRPDNQDSVFVSADASVFCVADGMGGGCDGALASAIVCEELKSSIANSGLDVKSAVELGILSANRRVRRHAEANGYGQMGSTIVLVSFGPGDARKAEVCHVGDSRAYRIRGGRAELLTDDHTLGNQISRSVCGKWADRLKGRGNPLSHVLTRAVGVTDSVSPEWSVVDVQAGDCFLICSDGVHDVMDDDSISELFSSGDSIEGFSEALRSEIYRRGAPDNFTYIIVKAGDAS